MPAPKIRAIFDVNHTREKATQKGESGLLDLPFLLLQRRIYRVRI